MIKIVKRILPALLTFLIAGCGVGDGIVGTGLEISGAAQKGPFVIGSGVTINLLRDDGSATDNTIVTETTDDLGNFSFYLDDAGLANITVTGYNFNEVTGHISNSTISLRSIYYASKTNAKSAYVNLLTHITHNRILTLLSEGLAPQQAISQAESEFLRAIKPVISAENLPHFTEMDIYNQKSDNTIGNAFLLTFSTIIYKYVDTISKSRGSSPEAELTLLISRLANEFSADGDFTEGSLLAELENTSRLIDPDLIRENLEFRSFQVLGNILDVADMNLFLDTDDDGIINSLDEDDDNDGIIDSNDTEPYGERVAFVDITSHSELVKVKGTIILSGVASKETQLVQVKLGNGPYTNAEGTSHWQLEIDTSIYPDGVATATAKAVQADWTIAEDTVKLDIENPPLVVIIPL